MGLSVSVLISAHLTSSPQEPGLDPKPILELPLVKLAQKLRTEELSLESVLCSYLEEVRVEVRGQGSGVRTQTWLWTGVGAVTCYFST